MYEIIVYEIILPVTVFPVRYSASCFISCSSLSEGRYLSAYISSLGSFHTGPGTGVSPFLLGKSASAYGYCLPVPAVHSSFFRLECAEGSLSSQRHFVEKEVTEGLFQLMQFCGVGFAEKECM